MLFQVRDIIEMPRTCGDGTGEIGRRMAMIPSHVPLQLVLQLETFSTLQTWESCLHGVHHGHVARQGRLADKGFSTAGTLVAMEADPVLEQLGLPPKPLSTGRPGTGEITHLGR